MSSFELSTAFYLWLVATCRHSYLKATTASQQPPTRSQSDLTFIYLFFRILLLSLTILKCRQYFLILQTPKLNYGKNLHFTKKKFGRIDSRVVYGNRFWLYIMVKKETNNQTFQIRNGYLPTILLNQRSYTWWTCVTRLMHFGSLCSSKNWPRYKYKETDF